MAHAPALDTPDRRAGDPNAARHSAWRRVRDALMAHPGLSRLGVVVVLLAIWEIAARFYVAKMDLAPPSRVFPMLYTGFQTRGMPAALQITLYELFVAFVLSVAIGLAIGLAVGLNRFANRSFMPIILLLYGTPKVVVLPLFILYFGIGPASKIAF